MTDKELFENWYINAGSVELIHSFLSACEIKNKRIKELEEKLNVAREAFWEILKYRCGEFHGEHAGDALEKIGN